MPLHEGMNQKKNYFSFLADVATSWKDNADPHESQQEGLQDL